MTSDRVHVLNNDVLARHVTLIFACTKIPNRAPRDRMELITESAEAVPAVAAEIDIPSKPGVKRKRSCRSATEKSKKPKKKFKIYCRHEQREQ